MKSFHYEAECLMLIAASIFASTSYDVSMVKEVNHNKWGAAWDTVIVVKNNIITIAAVPKLGGRVMQYDLGPHPSIYVDSNAMNTTITDGNKMVGGFRQLPSPQSDFNWPAPPTLDFGQYKYKIQTNNTDSCVVYLESGIENSTDTTRYKKHKGLQYKRTLTVYKASSRVKVDMVMLNKGTATLNHGIWDITQTDCSNNGQTDFENIWVYFPLNPNSTLGHGKGYVQYEQNGGNDTSQWNKNIVPGIMGVQYQSVVAKIGADCKGGWVCFVDKLDGYAYVKTFTYQENKTYPDSGASVQIYTYNSYNNTEVEVLGPLTSMAPNDSVTLVENWYAARSKGPVYSVSSAGLIAKPMSATTQSGGNVKVQGSYGVFYTGKIKAIFKTSGAEVAADSYAVSPNDSFVLNDTLKIAANATKIVLALYSSSGKLMGNLDSAAFTAIGVSDAPKAACFSNNKPLAIVQKGKSLVIDASYQKDYRLEMIGIDGRRLFSMRGSKPGIFSLPLTGLSCGVLFMKVYHGGIAETQRIFVK
jgi:hypothetical protein